KNDWYVYLRLTPKEPPEKSWWNEAQVVLYSPDIGKLDPRRADWALLPARIWFKGANDNEVTWTFLKPNMDVPLEAKHFVPPVDRLPKDWKIEKVGLPAALVPAPAPPEPTAPTLGTWMPAPGIAPTWRHCPVWTRRAPLRFVC